MTKGSKATWLEAETYRGDSGAGIFLQRGGVKYLIGINAYGLSPDWDVPNFGVWLGGQGSRDWIEANMNSDTHL